ncbi:MAG: hypothetical protein IT307_11440 [Chloroflexi bacterium]|nr:hypothetical protein [Chloroflexota bacterium]
MSPPTPADTAVRDGQRDGCVLCQGRLPSARARYCSAACRQRAYRWRHPEPAPPAPPATLTRELRRLGELVAHRVYECPSCEQRLLAERRCPDCNRFCRGLGLGGRCPGCDEPVLLSELLETWAGG